jgi:hypothetical protein
MYPGGSQTDPACIHQTRVQSSCYNDPANGFHVALIIWIFLVPLQRTMDRETSWVYLT